MLLPGLLREPLWACLLWCTLHSLDFFLTIAGERVRQRRAASVVRIVGSYELNPLFRKVVDERRWWSWRFVLSLVVMAAAVTYFSELCLASGRPEDVEALDILLGTLVFSRLLVIHRHLHNLWIFDRIARHPHSVVGEVTYDRRTVLGVSASQSAGVTVLLLAALAAAPSPFLLGGVIACVLLTVIGCVMALRAKPSAVPEPAASASAP
jgi:hypothetical protein